MKKFLMITLLAGAINLFGSDVYAQKTLGGGIAYGTEIESIGIHADAQFFINDNLAISPSVLYYFPKEIYEGFNYKWFEVNANANVYGIAGLNIAFISFPFLNFGGIFGGSDFNNSTSTKIGLNIGVGADFDIGSNIVPFGQLRYNISSFDQLAIEAGVRFPLD